MHLLIISLLMILVPLGAFALSFFARNKLAYWLLRIGGLYFALTAALSVIAKNLCLGDLVNGYYNCGGTNALTAFFSFITPALLVSISAYLLAGPVVLIIAVIAEIVQRSRKTA